MGGDVDGDAGKRGRRLRTRRAHRRAQPADSGERLPVGGINALGVVAMDAAGEQQAMLRMVEDRDGVEDRKPLMRQSERVMRRRREALVPPRRLVGEKADCTAEERRPNTRRGGNADRRNVAPEKGERILTLPGVADHARWPMAE